MSDAATGPPDSLDGAIGEGWSGSDPDGAHINVILGRRGSPTAAALMTAFTSPTPGHSPILVCVGEAKDAYEPIWPPTVMMNKATTRPGSRHEALTFGAAQLGIGQGVLDAVAEGLLEPTGETIVFVAIWVDERVDDETALRKATRTATAKAVATAVRGRDPAAARALVERRDRLRSPFYSGE
ncbi:MAG: 5,6,7,8-tetrahydromethanopterin hydro-lyase [Gaiellales bacterium]|nr:5,6,7,8-tetrahydromethanopterin hydro-lyase [Gaiellales bacterium]